MAVKQIVEFPNPGQIFERDGKQREVLSVIRHGVYPPVIQWRRPGCRYSIYGANIWTWLTWASKSKKVGRRMIDRAKEPE